MHLWICAWARFWLHRHSEGLSVIRVAWSSEELMMREAVAPWRPITYQPLTACGGLSCSVSCGCVCVCLPVCVHRMGFIAWEHIWGDISYYFSHDSVCHHLALNTIRICMIPLSVFDIWGGFMDSQSRIYYPIASLWLCQTFSTWETLSSSGSSSGLRSRLKMAEGSFPLPKLQGTDWQA